MSGRITRCIVDANVLFSVPKRDLIVSLSRAGLLDPFWTEIIISETRSALEKRFLRLNKGILRARRDVLRAVNMLEYYNPESKLIGDFSSPPDHINLPDPTDNHVLHVAIECDADYIVTENIQDFPKADLQSFAIETRTADQLISETIEEFPVTALGAINKLQLRMANPPVALDDLLSKWRTIHKLTATVASLEKYR